MALRILTPGRRLAVVYNRTLQQISTGLRALSTKDDIELDSDVVITVRQVQHASPAGELLGDSDHRLPLPGRVGLVEQLSPPPPAPPTMQQAAKNYAAAEFYHDRHMAALFSLLTPSTASSADAAPSPSDAVPEMVLLEIQAYQCPQLLKQEFRSLFRERDITQGPLTVLVVSQKTDEDMASWSESVQEERTQLTQYFMSVGGDMVRRLRRLGFWADLVDPRSGRPHLGDLVPAAHSDREPAADGDEPDRLIETDDRLAMLGFTIDDLGCCKVVQHAAWGTHVFIGCMFTDAGVDDPLLNTVISKYSDIDAPSS